MGRFGVKMDLEIDIPYNHSPRIYQIPFWSAMEDGRKRACLVWHRRSGKDLTAVNWTVTAMTERIGTYYHAFPEYNQGRKVMWDGMDGEGKKFTDHIPKDLRKSTNNTEMKIELVNGSIWQIIGADNYDSVVGANPVGIVFSEWAISDKYPQAWDYFRPMLVENGGWAVFIYTPRGRNHGFDLYRDALDNPDWFCQLLTIDDTQVISREDIDRERRAGYSEDMIQQEFFCSFIASSEDIVIPFELIQTAMTRDVAYPKSPCIAGLDVARFGNDRTALVIRRAGEIVHVETWGQSDVVATAGRVMDRYRAKLFDAIAVDSIGIGAGVADILRANDIPVAMVQVSEKPMDPERFDSQRDELWWKLREWFEEGACTISRALMPHQRQALLKDIQDIRFTYSPIGKIKIEPKKDMKARLGFSPDVGDALCLTFTHNIKNKAPGRNQEVQIGSWANRNKTQYETHREMRN
jgi:hypothetical protein